MQGRIFVLQDSTPPREPMTHPGSSKPPGLLGCCYGQQLNALTAGPRSPVRGDDPQPPEQTRRN